MFKAGQFVRANGMDAGQLDLLATSEASLSKVDLVFVDPNGRTSLEWTALPKMDTVGDLCMHARTHLKREDQDEVILACRLSHKRPILSPINTRLYLFDLGGPVHTVEKKQGSYGLKSSIAESYRELKVGDLGNRVAAHPDLRLIYYVVLPDRPEYGQWEERAVSGAYTMPAVYLSTKQLIEELEHISKLRGRTDTAYVRGLNLTGAEAFLVMHPDFPIGRYPNEPTKIEFWGRRPMITLMFRPPTLFQLPEDDK